MLKGYVVTFMPVLKILSIHTYLYTSSIRDALKPLLFTYYSNATILYIHSPRKMKKELYIAKHSKTIFMTENCHSGKNLP